MGNKNNKIEHSQEIQAVIVEELRKGNYLNVACQRAGVGYAAVKMWLRQGRGLVPARKPTPELIAFVDAVEEAEAECESKIVAYVHGKATEDVNVALKFLSLRWPDRWGNRPKKEETDDEWLDRAKRMIHNGEITKEEFEAEFGSEVSQDVINELFREVAPRGVTVAESGSDESK